MERGRMSWSTILQGYSSTSPSSAGPAFPHTPVSGEEGPLPPVCVCIYALLSMYIHSIYVCMLMYVYVLEFVQSVIMPGNVV